MAASEVLASQLLPEEKLSAAAAACLFMLQRRAFPAAGAQLRADSYWWEWGDEADQALCGEAFDLAREKARLETELVLRDQMQEHGKPKYLRVNASQLAAISAADVNGVVALTEPFTYHREGRGMTHFPGLIDISVLPRDVASAAHHSELLGIPFRAPRRHSQLAFDEQSHDQETWVPIPTGQQPTRRYLRLSKAMQILRPPGQGSAVLVDRTVELAQRFFAAAEQNPTMTVEEFRRSIGDLPVDENGRPPTE